MTGFLLFLLASFAPSREEILFSYLEKNAPCPHEDQRCLRSPFIRNEREENILVFISFAVPLATWQDYDLQMRKTGGVFVLRGIPENSFSIFSEKLGMLRKEGVYSSIDIDPEAFESYGIEAAPAIVLRDKERFDKLSGNIRLDEALRLFAEKGETGQ